MLKPEAGIFPITPIEGHNNVPGHWHWHKNEYNDDYWEITVTPVLPGDRGWNCLCPDQPTHSLEDSDQYGYQPDKPLIIHSEW